MPTDLSFADRSADGKRPLRGTFANVILCKILGRFHHSAVLERQVLEHPFNRETGNLQVFPTEEDEPLLVDKGVALGREPC